MQRHEILHAYSPFIDLAAGQMARGAFGRFWPIFSFFPRICRCILQCFYDIILKKLNDYLHSFSQELSLDTVGVYTYGRRNA